MQGHSKNDTGYGFDGMISVFSEVLASFGDGNAAFADEANSEVSQCRERSGSCPDSASVLVEGDVSDVMEAVLDGPMVTGQRHDALGSGVVRWQTGDEIGDLDAFCATDYSVTFQPHDLRQPGPVEICDSLSREGNAPYLDAAMAFFDRLCLSQIRRRVR